LVGYFPRLGVPDATWAILCDLFPDGTAAEKALTNRRLSPRRTPYVV
jgi:hypothetical protein